MQVGTVDQYQGHQQHQADRDQFHGPEQSAVQMTDHDVHADMATQPLGIGDAEKGHERHGLFDPVDIAIDRQRKKPTSQHIGRRQEDQQEDHGAADEVQQGLEFEEQTVGDAQFRVVFEDRC